MGCLKGADEDVASSCASSEDHSLRSLLSFRQSSLSDPPYKTLQWKLGLGCVTYKTLQARSRLLDTASHGLAKAKELQKTLKSGGNATLSELNPKTESLFPLPLPPGYQPLNSKLENPNPGSNRSTNSMQEAFTPSSTASSNSVFGASLTSSSGSSSSSSSSSNDQALQAVASSLKPNNQRPSTSASSLLQLLPLPSLETELRAQQNAGAKSEEAQTMEISAHQVAQACGNFKDTHRLRNGAMGPLYRATLHNKSNNMAGAKEKVAVIERVEINMGYRRWKAQIHSLAAMTHPNLCKIIGYSYERVITEHDGHVQQWRSMGYIIWDNPPKGNLYELLHNNGLSSHIEWHTRLKIAIGVAKGIGFLLGKLPNQSLARLKMKNIKLDTSFNPMIFDYVLVGTSPSRKGGDIVRDFGLMLLELFNFSSYPQVEAEGTTELDEMPLIGKDSRVKDAKVVIDLAASCLLPHPSLRPSMQYVVHTLQRLHQPTRFRQSLPISSKSGSHHKRRNYSFA